MGRISITQPAKFACENCHGPGSAHVAAGGGRGVGGIMSFEADDPRSVGRKERRFVSPAMSAANAPLWQGSIHEDARAGLHQLPHDHEERVAQEPTEDRVRSRTPASSATRIGARRCSARRICRCAKARSRARIAIIRTAASPKLLLKKDSINDVCYTCHAEKRGPFLFEHEPVRENCDNCHDPHGTVNEYSLKIARPRLCNECHNFGMDNTAGPTVESSRMGQSCENCHTAIHGSNSPAGGCVATVSGPSRRKREETYVESLLRGGCNETASWIGHGHT